MLAHVRFASENVPHKFPHEGHAGHTTHDDDLVNILRLQPRIVQGAPTERAGAFDNREGGLRGADGGRVFFQFSGFENRDAAFGREGGIEIITTEAGVAIGGEDVKNAAAEFEHGHIKGAAAEVIDDNLAFLSQPVEAIRQRRRGGFGQQALDGEARQFPRAFGRGTLGIVEISGHRDHSPIHRLTFSRWASATRPTTASPWSGKYTAEGVSRCPSASAKRTGNPESIAPMSELVVPRSMPTIMRRSLNAQRGTFNAVPRVGTAPGCCP